MAPRAASPATQRFPFREKPAGARLHTASHDGFLGIPTEQPGEVQGMGGFNQKVWSHIVTCCPSPPLFLQLLELGNN